MMVVGNKILPISNIKVGDRARKKLGNIKSLADDINSNGQIVPIVITEDNELIDGGRRLEALKLLGSNEVSCSIARLVETDNMLRLELSSNEERKDFTDEEKLELLEKLKLPHGGNRGNQYNKKVPSGSNETLGKTSYEIQNNKAKAVGFSSHSDAKRAKRIFTKGIDELRKAVANGVIKKSPASAVAKLPEDEQVLALEAHKKYGKWQYYEYPKTIINNLENGNISQHEADGYMISLKNGKMTSEQISRDITALAKAKTKAIGAARGEEIYNEDRRKAKEDREEWIDVRLAKRNLFKSVEIFIEELDYPNRNSLLEYIRQIYKKKGKYET